MFSSLRLSEKAFVIAEVGQNHQGELDIAKEYVRTFSRAGADAIKFQTRNNRYLFSKEAFEAPYNSENAFAETYGAHRERLELRPEWLAELKRECHESGVYFMSTAFDEPSLDLLVDVGVDAIKIASFDVGNIPLISRVAGKQKPVVLSTGGGKWAQIEASVNALTASEDTAVLHCVSKYPCEAKDMGLGKLSRFASSFPDVAIGLSDHYNGTLSGPLAFLLGARVFEKHVTLNRAMKGTDHSFSLEPEGFRKFVRDLRRTPEMLGVGAEEALGQEPVFSKLGKSLIALKDIKDGEQITAEHLSGRIFSVQGIPVRESHEVIGRCASREVAAGEKILPEMLA